MPLGEESASSPSLAADLAAETIEVSERERAVFRALWLETFRAIPDEGVEWLSDKIARNGIPVSIGQIRGFTQFRADSVEVLASGTTTSTSYADLTNVGPELTQLSSGVYLLLYSATLSNAATSASNFISISVNGAVASDDDSAVFESTFANQQSTVVRAVQKTLANPINSVKVQYKHAGGSTLTGKRRWLIALKTENA